MSTTRALIAADLALSTTARAAAFSGRLEADALPLNLETAARRKARAMLDAAALNGLPVRCAFYKKDLTLRYMLALPCLGVDATAAYYTVQDLEKSDERGQPVYRRVCLDALAGLSFAYMATCH